MGKKFTYRDSRQNYPGPGNYIRFSEFGILGYKNKTNKVNKSVDYTATAPNEKSADQSQSKGN